MITLDIVLSGDDLVARAADDVLRRSGMLLEQGVQSFGKRYRDAMVAATPRGKGETAGRRRLHEAYDVEEHYSESAAFYGFTNEEFYLKWVLGGRPAIEAKPGRMLRFTIEGRVLYRKRVGPASANPFDKGVIDSFQDEGAQLGEQISGQIIRVFEE